MTSPRHDPRPAEEAWLYAPFRPRFARVAGSLVAVLVVVGCTVIALTGQGPSFTVTQRVAIIVWGLLVGAAALWLVAANAHATPSGLRVHNLVRSRTLEWPEIVAVRFGRDDPWVTLDLADGTTLAVLAVQRADGAHGVRDANRLVALVRRHGQAEEPGPSGEPGPTGEPGPPAP